jgi:hypothetical protein
MKRTAGILAFILVASLLGVSDVRGGAALVPAGKTTGASLTATIVTDVTGQSFTVGKGLTSIRVQKSSTSAAILFDSGYVNSLVAECIQAGFDLQGSTNARFVGLMNGWVDQPGVLNALLGQFGDPTKAAITDTDYASCTSENGRQILSFTAVIQFQAK